MNKTVAANTDAMAELPSPKLPRVDPAAVSVNVDGQVFRFMFARLPAGLVADDLKDPTIWQKVQSSRRTSLRKFDHLYIVSADEHWSADAVVGDADEAKAVLIVSKIISMPERFDQLPADDKYFSRWNGATYELVRRSDGHVAARAANVPLLWRELAQQYPKPVAA